FFGQPKSESKTRVVFKQPLREPGEQIGARHHQNDPVQIIEEGHLPKQKIDSAQDMGMGQIHEKGVRGYESEEKTPSRIGIELRGNLVLGFQEKQQRGDAIEDHGPAVEMIGFIKAL